MTNIGVLLHLGSISSSFRRTGYIGYIFQFSKDVYKRQEEKLVGLRKGGLWNRNRPLKPKTVKKITIIIIIIIFKDRCV